MSRVDRYLLNHFSGLFASLFFILFFITSIVFLIKITTLTSIIQMNFLELGTLYIYLLPRTLLYTLPVTFFIALALSLFQLSKENETIVLFTLGYNPKKIASLFFKLASFLSLMLIVDLIILVPISRQLNNNFIDYKKAEAKFNIKASEFGQKFSDWFVYIQAIDAQNVYRGVTLYQLPSAGENEKLILAQKATMETTNGALSLNLEKGKIFDFSQNTLQEVHFESMRIHSKPKNTLSPVQTIVEYWDGVFKDKKRAYDLSFFLLISLFPLASTWIALSLGIVTYRYHREGIYLSLFATIALYLTLTTLFSTWYPQSAPLLVFSISLMMAYRVYQKRIQQIF